MQPTFYEIKRAAKRALTSRWPEAILVFVSFIAVCLINSVSQSILMHLFKVEALWSIFAPAELPRLEFIASIGITMLSALFSFIITFPFLLGVLKWFWSVTNGSNAHLYEIFYFFQSGRLYKKAFSFSLTLYLRVLLIALVCFLPYIVAKILTSPTLYILLNRPTPIFISGLFNMVDIFQGLGIISVAVLNVAHLIFPAVLFIYPELSVLKTVKRAKAISHVEPLKLISFVFSFTGWFLLCLFVIPLVFVGPYFIASLSIYGREESLEYERRNRN